MVLKSVGALAAFLAELTEIVLVDKSVAMKVVSKVDDWVAKLAVTKVVEKATSLVAM